MAISVTFGAKWENIIGLTVTGTFKVSKGGGQEGVTSHYLPPQGAVVCKYCTLRLPNLICAASDLCRSCPSVDLDYHA